MLDSRPNQAKPPMVEGYYLAATVYGIGRADRYVGFLAYCSLPYMQPNHWVVGMWDSTEVPNRSFYDLQNYPTLELASADFAARGAVLLKPYPEEAK